MKKVNSIWVILDGDDNFCAFGTKVAWISLGAAKNAFSFHTHEYSKGYRTPVKIEDCPEYKLVEIKQ